MKLTLKQLKDLISSYRTALNEAENFERLGFDIRSSEMWYYLEHALDIALTLYFGENVSEKIWNFILNDSVNEFATIEELFEFVSDKYSELVDIISTLSEDSIVLLIEIYRDYIEQNKVEDSNNAIRITNKLHISYEDFISTCYLLSGKGLIKQVPLASNSFFPVPTSWLESIIHLLQVGED